jgi:hypothetical protein
MAIGFLSPPEVRGKARKKQKLQGPNAAKRFGPISSGRQTRLAPQLDAMPACEFSLDKPRTGE